MENPIKMVDWMLAVYFPHKTWSQPQCVVSQETERQMCRLLIRTKLGLFYSHGLKLETE